MSSILSPIPLSEIESVLAWIDTYKLSRPCRKIHRDFSDGVLLAEILCFHYPKLVEMHNYPSRNSHALKLNNWMTLNRKVLKKLKLNICCNTMEQLANCSPGVIERVCVMVRDKIRRDEDANKKEMELNVSSGGSYYEACGDEENVLVVPVKTRVNGILETIQQKVVSYDTYLNLQEELKDAKETTELLKQKVGHLDSLLKLRDERIEELQKQLERKQIRRKEVEALQNSLCVPFEEPPSPKIIENIPLINNKPSTKSVESPKKTEVSKIPLLKTESIKKIPAETNNANSAEEVKDPLNVNVKCSLVEVPAKVSAVDKTNPIIDPDALLTKSESRSSNLDVKPKASVTKTPRSSKIDLQLETDVDIEIPIVLDKQESKSNENIERVQSDVFKEIEIVKSTTGYDMEEFKDSVEDIVITIEESIENELIDLTNKVVVEFREADNLKGTTNLSVN